MLHCVSRETSITPYFIINLLKCLKINNNEIKPLFNVSHETIKTILDL